MCIGIEILVIVVEFFGCEPKTIHDQSHDELPRSAQSEKAGFSGGRRAALLAGIDQALYGSWQRHD